MIGISVLMDKEMHKALRLLDAGQTGRAVTILEEIIAIARQERMPVLLVRASCVLGEVYYLQGQLDSARTYFTDVLNTPLDTDVADYEKGRAADLLDRII